jgi:hypothetical protein
MPKHVTSFVPAHFVALLATVALIALWSSAAHGEKNCVTEPDLQAAQGGHWYYRIDRASGRRCWFIGPPQATKVRRASQPNAQQLPMPIPRPAVSTAAEVTAGEQTRMDFPGRSPGELESLSAMGFDTASMRDPERDERSETNAGEEMPLIWPVLTDAELAAAQPADPGHMPGLGTVLAFASAVAFAGIGWAIFAHLAVRRLRRRDRRAQSDKLRNLKVRSEEARAEVIAAITASRYPGNAPEPEPAPSSDRVPEVKEIHQALDELLRLVHGPARTAAA